ncbi:hypothetical protein [Persephonella sp.]
MDWPQLEHVFKIKPVTDEKSQRRLWNVHKKRKEKKYKEEKKGKGIKGNKVDIYV